MVSLWQFAVERGYVADNPAKQIKAPVVIAEEPGTLTPAEMIRLLNVAAGDLLAYVAIAGFAGLRRAEIERLDWSDVDMDTREIDVKALIAKSKKRRIVAIPDNLHLWLDAVHLGNGTVVGRNLASNLPRIAKAAKIEPWPQNCLRHSFASYHLANHENAASTAFLMGHRDSNLVYSVYARAVRSTDAAKWWAIIPLP
jgi:integrase